MKARDVGALAAAGLVDEAGTDAGPEELGAVAGDGAELPADVAAGGGVVGVLAAGGGVVGAEGEVEPVVGAAVVGVVGVAVTRTTVNPPMLFPVTSPGDVSPTKVYSGEPL